MEYKIINYSKKEIDEIFPPRVAGLYKTPGFRVFSATDKESVLAFIVVTLDKKEGDFVINYITDTEEENERAVRGLLEYIIEECENFGGARLFVRLIDDKPSIIQYNKILLALGFEPIFSRGHYLVYDVSDLRETEFYKQIPKMKNIINRVVGKEDTTKPQRGKIGEFALDNGIDKNFAKFYLSNGKITGCLDLRDMGEGILFLKNFYIDKKARDKYIFPGMLASVLEVFDEGKIIMPFYEEDIYKAVKSILGKPKNDELISEYYLRF